MLHHRLKNRATITLQFPQYVRHADVRERQVVPAGGLAVVTVERAHVGIEVVRATALRASARAGNHRQIGWVGAKPLGGLLGINGRLHGVADLAVGHKEVVLDLLGGQTDVLQTVEAHERRRMTIQAIVGKQLGTVLQRRHVIGPVGRLVPGDTALARRRAIFNRGLALGYALERTDGVIISLSRRDAHVIEYVCRATGIGRNGGGPW